MRNQQKPKLLKVSNLARRINASLYPGGTKSADSGYMEYAKRVTYGW
jgi:hypothetical protein